MSLKASLFLYKPKFQYDLLLVDCNEISSTAKHTTEDALNMTVKAQQYPHTQYEFNFLVHQLCVETLVSSHYPQCPFFVTVFMQNCVHAFVSPVYSFIRL